MKFPRALAVLVLSAICISVPLQSSADTTARIGAILPMSGDLAPFGKIVLDGLLSSGLPASSLIVEDDACRPAKTVTAYKKLTEIDRVDYIVGPLCGSPQQSIAPLLAHSQQIMIIPGSGAEGLYSLSGGKVFSVQYSNEQEARYNAGVLEKLAAKRVALVFYEDVFCRTHERAFRAHFKGEVAEALTFSSMDPEAIRSIALRLKALKVDGVYVPDVSPFLMGFLTDLAKIGVKGIPVVSIYSAQLKDLLTVERANANGLMYSYPVIGDKDAVSYFPRRTGEILQDLLAHCQGDTGCATKQLRASYPFDEQGVMRGEIETKIIKDDSFQRLAPLPRSAH